MPKRHRPGSSATRVIEHIEEVVLATSGEDAFELTFAVASARVAGHPRGDLDAISKTARAHPHLGIRVPRDVDASLLERVDALLDRALPDAQRAAPGRGVGLEALDAVFESLVPRLAKSEKGQFFTPRHVVDFVIGALAPRAGDIVVDPACGSGAFLAHAHDHAEARTAKRRRDGAGKRATGVATFGADVDARAVRIARLVALSQGRDPTTLQRADGLRSDAVPAATIVATNPPFAGRADAAGFEVARVVRTPERDVLFLERALDLLAPGGRLGIVLPYNKAAGASFAALRRWLVSRARVLAVVALPRETFLPHTAQRTFVLFAQRRPKTTMRASANERVMFLISERAGKNAAGEPIRREDGAPGLDHDLDEVSAQLYPFLRGEGFSS